MALAIEAKRLIESRAISAASATTWMTQILNLAILAPCIQVEILHMNSGCHVRQAMMKDLVAERLWLSQREPWNECPSDRDV